MRIYTKDEVEVREDCPEIISPVLFKAFVERLDLTNMNKRAILQQVEAYEFKIKELTNTK